MARREDEHRRRVERIEREHDRRLETAHHPLAQDLFPALDSLDEAVDQSDDPDQTSADDLREGLQLARESLYDALARHGITPVEPTEGDDFDPECHEAIARTESREADDGTIQQRFRRGYRDGAQVLRPALVQVWVDPGQREASSSSDESGSDPDDELDEEAGAFVDDESDGSPSTDPSGIGPDTDERRGDED